MLAGPIWVSVGPLFGCRRAAPKIGPESVRISSPSGRSDPSVKRRALLQRASQRLDHSPETSLRHLLSVRRAGRPRDVLVHQRAAQIVGAGLQDLLDALHAHLDPTDLDVLDGAAVGDAAHGVNEERLAEGGTAP